MADDATTEKTGHTDEADTFERITYWTNVKGARPRGEIVMENPRYDPDGFVVGREIDDDGTRHDDLVRIPVIDIISRAACDEPGAADGIDMADVKAFVELSKQKAELTKQLKGIQATLDETADRIVDGFVQDGVDRIRADGMTVYLHRQKWAGIAGVDELGKVEATARAIDALRAAGLTHLITLGTQGISAVFRDEEAVDGMPPEVVDAFDVVERVGIRARRTN